MLLTVVLLYGCSSTSERPRARIDNALPLSALGYKVGKAYRVKGVWYYPQIDYDYAEVGVASWYGPGFHGRSTANGEEYDMNDLTAAHRTLPMPSIVRVTNLENGRSIKLRVNDRGPFVGERIIDVSRRAAQLLGFYGNGTARVRVEIVADESKQLAAALGVPVDVAVAERRTEQPVAEVASAYSSPEPLEPQPQPYSRSRTSARSRWHTRRWTRCRKRPTKAILKRIHPCSSPPRHRRRRRPNNREAVPQCTCRRVRSPMSIALISPGDVSRRSARS